MQYLYLFSFVFLTSVISIQASLSRVILPADPDNPNHCYSEQPPMVNLEAGKSAQIAERCQQYNCKKNSDGTFTLTIFSCAPMHSDRPNCRIVQNLNKPYPDCCGELVC